MILDNTKKSFNLLNNILYSDLTCYSKRSLFKQLSSGKPAEKVITIQYQKSWQNEILTVKGFSFVPCGKKVNAPSVSIRSLFYVFKEQDRT